jgi:ribokinase
VAFIQVDSGGQNTIVVSPGANHSLGPDALDVGAFEGARVVLLQLEVPLATARRAARLGRAAGATVVLNNAPAVPLGADVLAEVDVLLVNESEAGITLGRAPGEAGDAPEAILEALRARVPSAVLTLGGRGSAWVGAGSSRQGRAPAFPVHAVDTTAAGDAFAGALAVRLAAGAALGEAVRYANAAGALAATREGAQPSLPRADAVDVLLAGGVP